jgi:hypothetical protein
MESSPTLVPLSFERDAPTVMRWRIWPLVEHRRWSWLVPLSVLAMAGMVAYYGGSWFIGLFAAAALAASLWQFWLPVNFEMDALGVRRRVLGRTRFLPWSAVRAYQPRADGVVLFQRPDPTPIDALRSVFLPYAEDEDESLCAVRQHLQHAVELPG